MSSAPAWGSFVIFQENFDAEPPDTWVNTSTASATLELAAVGGSEDGFVWRSGTTSGIATTEITRTISTVGRSNIGVSFRAGGTGSLDPPGNGPPDFMFVEYTLDGINFSELFFIDGNDFPSIPGFAEFDATAIAGASNNADFGIRITSTLTGPDEGFFFDTLTVTAVPEASTLALIGIGGLGLVVVQRRPRRSEA